MFNIVIVLILISNYVNGFNWNLAYSQFFNFEDNIYIFMQYFFLYLILLYIKELLPLAVVNCVL